MKWLLPTVMGGNLLPSIIIDSFGRADGVLGGRWIAPTWTISTNKAINTPVGTDLAINGTFTDWTLGVPDGFTLYQNSPPDHEVTQVGPTEGHGGVGTGAANIFAGASGHGLRTNAFTANTLKWLKLAFTESKKVTGNINANIGQDTIYSAEGANSQTYGGGSTFAGIYSSGAADVTIDDLSLKEYGVSEFGAYQKGNILNPRITATVLKNAKKWQGGLIMLDSITNPLYGAMLYINYANVNAPKLCVDKIVNGVRSNEVNATISLANTAHAHTLVLHQVDDNYYYRYINLITGSYAERLNGVATISGARVNPYKYFGLFGLDGITYGDFSAFPATKVHNTFWLGDSKLTQAYNNCPYYFSSSQNIFEEAPERYATAGILMAGVKAGIDAWLAAATETPEYVFFNVGVNDANASPVTDETQFKADMQYILDAIHTKHASTKIKIMAGVYRTSKPTECATVSGWIRSTMEANSAFCSEWADELVWYAPHMATLSSDDVHYSVAGCQEAARLGRVSTGLA
jgi:hypothetical protein